MSDREMVVLFAAALAFVASMSALIVTIVGWRENRDTLTKVANDQAKATAEIQKQIEEMKQDFALGQERRQYILPDQMKELKRTKDLMVAGHELAHQIWICSVTPPDSARFTVEDLFESAGEWNNEYDKCMTIAIQYGRSPMSMSWDETAAWRETGGLPDTLPLVLYAMQEEIGGAASALDKHYAAEQAVAARDLVERLYLHGISLVDAIQTGLFIKRHRHEPPA